MVSLYRKDYQIGVEHIDFDSHLKLSSLLTYFQDIANLHAKNLGVGMETLYKKYNALWVLARMRIDIIKYPLWNEKVTIESWPLEPNRIEFSRDYLVKDENQNILAKAVSTWIIMDAKSRKLKRAKGVNIKYPSPVKERAIFCRLGRLKSQGPLDLAAKRKVSYSDIDVNKHLNSSRYIDFIMDSFTLKEHEKYNIKSIEINYSKEALSGDIIAIYKDTCQAFLPFIYMEGINESNDKLTFKAQIEIETK